MKEKSNELAEEEQEQDFQEQQEQEGDFQEHQEQEEFEEIDTKKINSFIQNVMV